MADLDTYRKLFSLHANPHKPDKIYFIDNVLTNPYRTQLSTTELNQYSYHNTSNRSNFYIGIHITSNFVVHIYNQLRNYIMHTSIKAA